MKIVFNFLIIGNLFVGVWHFFNDDYAGCACVMAFTILCAIAWAHLDITEQLMDIKKGREG